MVWPAEPHQDILDFRRSNVWPSITNLHHTPRALPPGKVLFASGVITEHGTLPPETTVWLQT